MVTKTAMRNLFSKRLFIIISAAILAGWILPTAFFSVVEDLGSNTSTSRSLFTATTLPPEDERLAIVTYLSSLVVLDKDPKDDHYFQAARLLGYQLLHANETRVRRKTIDYVVLVAPDVSQSRKDILAQDGAVVIPVEYVHVEGEDWLLNGEADAAWKDLMTKFRAWELSQYSRALFVDGDTMLTNCCIEDVFDDPASFPVKRTDSGTQLEDEYPVPDTYLLASIPEPLPVHSWPPTFSGQQHAGIDDIDYICAGFFIFAPSFEMFQHYCSLISLPGRFDARLMEQSLLNYAHRRHGGQAPWQDLGYYWNVRFPRIEDVEEGAISVHDKWWAPQLDGEWERKILPLYTHMKFKLDGWTAARDSILRAPSPS